MNPLGATTADKTDTWGQLDLHQKHLKMDGWKMILFFAKASRQVLTASFGESKYVLLLKSWKKLLMFDYFDTPNCFVPQEMP